MTGPDGVVDADAEAEADGATLGTAVGSGVAVAMATDGRRVGDAAGSGAKARMPPNSATATTTPVDRPATMVDRGDMTGGGYQYERPTASVGTWR